MLVDYLLTDYIFAVCCDHCESMKEIRKVVVKASTEYGTHIHASVEKGNVFACQFHPEKSSDVGLKILENFAKL